MRGEGGRLNTDETAKGRKSEARAGGEGQLHPELEPGLPQEALSLTC